MPTLPSCEVMPGRLCSIPCCCFSVLRPAACAWRTVEVINVSVGRVPTGKLLRRRWPGNVCGALPSAALWELARALAVELLQGQLSWPDQKRVGCIVVVTQCDAEVWIRGPWD